LRPNADTIQQTLNNLLAKGYEAGFEVEPDITKLRIIDSLDIGTITGGHSGPIDDSFTSPFLGYSFDQVEEWFTANITTGNKGHASLFSPHTFLVLDKDTVPSRPPESNGSKADSNSESHSGLEQASESTASVARDEADEAFETALVCTTNSDDLQCVRTDFYVTLMLCQSFDFGRTMDEGTIGYFQRAGETVTLGAYNIVSSNGIYTDRGVPTYDEEWREWMQTWAQPAAA
jgi:hypothetical protein